MKENYLTYDTIEGINGRIRLQYSPELDKAILLSENNEGTPSTAITFGDPQEIHSFIRNIEGFAYQFFKITGRKKEFMNEYTNRKLLKEEELELNSKKIVHEQHYDYTMPGITN